jgi:uncharacterized membrane protein
VTTLHGAVTFSQIDSVTLTVSQHLNFDVRGFSRYFSMYTMSLLKAALASALVMEMDCASSASLRTTRIPRPPPPPEALMITG